MKTVNLIAFSSLLALAGSTLAHNHVTVDTAGGQALIRAGYYPAEAAYGIDGLGQLTFSGVPLTVTITDQLSGGTNDGWFGGDEVVLSSDFYFATGRLGGGDFAYELGISTVAGEDSAATWGLFAGTVFNPSASTAGGTRPSRSFGVGVGNHIHGQGFAISGLGLYRVSLTAWDRNGVYADSAPVTFFVQTVPTPGAAGTLALAGVLAAGRRRRAS